MAERLAAGNLAVALIANTGATVAVLATLIALLGPVSGAHFNPAVSLVQALRGALSWREAGAYAAIQILGCARARSSRTPCSRCRSSSPRHMRGPASPVARRVRGDPRPLLVILGHRSLRMRHGGSPPGSERPTGSPRPLRSRIPRLRSHARSRIPSPESRHRMFLPSSSPNCSAHLRRFLLPVVCLVLPNPTPPRYQRTPRSASDTHAPSPTMM